MDNEPKVVVVTGASSGLGRSCADYLAGCGYRVYGTYRRTAIEGAGFEPLVMDVDDEDSVCGGMRRVLDAEGRIDVLICCAGYGVAGSVEDTSIEEAQAQFNTNVFGVMRACRAVLPHMRQRGDGLIIIISSLGGLISAPYHGLYCSSKFAIEGLAEALRMEVERFGVRVSMIEPGDFRTGFTANRVGCRECGPDYRECYEKSVREMARSEQNGADPVLVARLAQRIIESGNPRLRYPVGPRFQLLAPVLKKFLPQGVFEKIIKSFYKID